MKSSTLPWKKERHAQFVSKIFVHTKDDDDDTLLVDATAMKKGSDLHSLLRLFFVHTIFYRFHLH